MPKWKNFSDISRLYLNINSNWVILFTKKHVNHFTLHIVLVHSFLSLFEPIDINTWWIFGKNGQSVCFGRTKLKFFNWLGLLDQRNRRSYLTELAEIPNNQFCLKNINKHFTSFRFCFVFKFNWSDFIQYILIRSCMVRVLRVYAKSVYILGVDRFDRLCTSFFLDFIRFSTL